MISTKRIVIEKASSLSLVLSATPQGGLERNTAQWVTHDCEPLRVTRCAMMGFGENKRQHQIKSNFNPTGLRFLNICGSRAPSTSSWRFRSPQAETLQ